MCCCSVSWYANSAAEKKHVKIAQCRTACGLSGIVFSQSESPLLQAFQHLVQVAALGGVQTAHLVVGGGHVRHHLDGWGLTHYFKVIVSGEQFSASKPDPEIFLRAAEALGTARDRTLVLEDSYNGVRAGAAGGFVTVMVPDLAPADDEMRSLYTAECKDLREVKKMLEEGKLLSEA